MPDGYTERPGPKPKLPPPSGPATWAKADRWDEASLPPRPWLAPGYFLRGAVTTVIGPGGVSKSSLVVAWAIALALKRELGTMKPRSRFKCAIFNVEDDSDEQERRLSAALTSVGKTPEDIAGQILRTGPTKVGTLFEQDPETREIVPTLAMREVERELVAFGADILFVDPLAELHGVEENDNVAMRAVVAEFRVLAARCKLAVVIVHHTRKGMLNPGDADAARGASSIVGASRIVLTVVGMTEDVAKAFSLPDGHEKHFFRLDGGKANYSTLTDCEWFERVVYTLANDDTVAVTVPWDPPRDSITPEVQAKVEAAVRRGSTEGPFSPMLGNTARSVKQPMVDAGITTRPGQQEMLEALLKAGFTKLKFQDRASRKKPLGLRSPEGLPEAEWIEDADA